MQGSTYDDDPFAPSAHATDHSIAGTHETIARSAGALTAGIVPICGDTLPATARDAWALALDEAGQMAAEAGHWQAVVE